MRTIVATLSLILASCHAPHEKALTDGQRAQQVALAQADLKQKVSAFGGTLIGRDDGEWGGEVAFRDQSGNTYTVVPDNSHGIFKMPYGVVPLTGLAHLGIDRGNVYLLSREPNANVVATKIMELPGAPCDVARNGDRITMRISAGSKTLANGLPTTIFACYSLNSQKNLVEYECPEASETDPGICFG